MAGHPKKAPEQTYCLRFKFPTDHKIGEIRGDQVLTREYYQIVFVGKENHTWIVKEKQQEPVEELKSVELVERNASKPPRKSRCVCLNS